MNKKYFFKAIVSFMLLFIITVFAVFKPSMISEASSNNTQKNFTSNKFQQTYKDSLTKAIMRSKSLDASKYEINFVTDTPKSNVIYKKCNSIKEIVSLLEKDENDLLKNSDINRFSMSTISASSTSKAPKTVSKKYSRGWTPRYTLSADITYNTKTNKITSVSNRNFSLSGITIAVGAEDKKYSTKYYDNKKKVRVRCDYTAVRYVMTPAGRVEISRRGAYQHFYYSVAKDVHDGSGGYK